MGTKTGIEWADATWNPWQGCTKVSPACAHCYMFRDMARYGKCARQAAASRVRPRTDVPTIPDCAEGEIEVITDDLPPRAPLPVAPAAPRRAVEPAARSVAKSEPEEIPCPHCGGSGRIKAGKEALCSRG